MKCNSLRISLSRCRMTWLGCLAYWLVFVFKYAFSKEVKDTVLRWRPNGGGGMLLMKMAHARAYHLFMPAEFFECGLDRREWGACKEFFSDLELCKVCQRMNPEIDLFRNKLKTYERYKKYYKRRLMLVADDDAFKSFYDSVDKLFLKPLSLSCSRGVRIVKTNEMRLSDFIAMYKGYLAEELIVQSEYMSEFNPSSVNTFRIATFKFPNRIEIAFTYLIIGRQGTWCCDCEHEGAIVCLIDSATGIIVKAVDLMRNQYSVHPDSGRQLIGFQIPNWEEAKKMCIELAGLTNNRYSSWDLAATPDGWVMVEGNVYGSFGTQVITYEGVRERVMRAMAEMGV